MKYMLNLMTYAMMATVVAGCGTTLLDEVGQESLGRDSWNYLPESESSASALRTITTGELAFCGSNLCNEIKKEPFGDNGQKISTSEPVVIKKPNFDFDELDKIVDEGDPTGVAESCPMPEFTPDKFSIDKDEPGTPFVDKNREIKDIGTTIVVREFFSTPDTLYNFMKLVYGTLDAALDRYKKENNLEELSMYILFKGGNVLRIVANEVFDMLTPEARNLLQNEYAKYFKRSDADFSVYIDEEKLGGRDYDQTFDEVAKMLFKELGVIRSEFKSNPQKYFNIMRLKTDFAQKVLGKYFKELGELRATEDASNKAWYQTKFYQLQLGDDRATTGPSCGFRGQYDYKYEDKGGEIVATRVSNSPNWITNTDNRTLEWPMGSDPSKLVKFSLVRSKAAFEYTFVGPDLVAKRKPIGGELIDVSMPHRDSSTLRSFLDNYEEAVAKYTLKAPDGDQVVMKAYSLSNLAEDLEFIIFDSFIRPWKGGPKYTKRINRLFFLYLVDMIGSYGTGSLRAKEYVADVREKILTPIKALYPIAEGGTAAAQQIKYNVGLISSSWTEMAGANEFWEKLAKFIDERLVKKPLDGDAEGFAGLIKAIEENLDIADKLSDMEHMKIDPEEAYDVELDNLF